MKRTMCRRCGNWFTTKGENTMCSYCIATTLGELYPEPERKPKRKAKESQLMKDAMEAKEHGVSYGEWMALKERGMRK